MVYVKKVKIKGKEYWYLFHTVRKGKKYLKKSRYIGKEIPTNIEELEKDFSAELRTQKPKKSAEQKLIETLHPLERAVLPVLEKGINLQKIIGKTKLKEVEIIRALQWLENKKIVKIKKALKEIISLDKNGLIYIKKGLPEKRFLEVLEQPLTLQQTQEKANLNKDELNISLGILKKKVAILIKKGKVKITPKGKELVIKELLEEQFLKALPLELSKLSPEQKYAYEELKKRKQIIKVELKKIISVELKPLAEKLIKAKLKTRLIETLTPDIIKIGTWKKKKFRRYDIKINVPKIYPAKRHFVNQAIAYMKKIWLDLGFKEMTGPLLGTAFWNFDALFVPQDHPAREMQDTFYIKEPKFGKLPNKRLVEKIKAVHENGWITNSSGWRCRWNEKKARELVLRTHTTILSARTIAALKKADLPAKFFAIGKCFRNEALDWKHSFEFYQVEGIVLDENVTFRHLLGYLKEYYKRLGFEKIRFRPSYFPYTEMSVEPEVYHPTKKEWIELGGAGIFRPEVVKPLLGIDIPVLAWGQGLERGIMDYYKIFDYRKLYGNDIKLLKEIKPWLK